MPHQNLDNTREFLLNKLGLDYSKKREKELVNKLGEAAKTFNFSDTQKFINWLITQPMNDEQTRLLANSLTIGETYFFRERKALDYLEFVYLPKLIRERKGKKQELKIWSAGCATGEEPYTIAILLQKIIPDIKNWKVTIFASDINASFILKAKKGIYSQWSFRQTPESFKDRHFKKVDKNFYRIKDSIKEMVKFSYVNLATDTYPSIKEEINDFDVILCRNVLIYFSAEGINKVAAKFYNSLKKQGTLLVSPVETSNLLNSKFGRISYNGYTVFQRDIDKTSSITPKYEHNTFSKQLIEYNTSDQVFEVKSNEEKPAESILSKKEINDLINAYTNQKKEKEKSSTINYASALMFYKSGQFDKAENQLKTLIKEKGREQKSCFLLLAKVYANKGELDRSEKMCNRTIAHDKINIEAHYLLATVFSEQNKNTEAIRALNKTLFLDPNFVLAHFLMGNILRNKGDSAGSKKQFDNALKSLEYYSNDALLSESDGLSAGRLRHIIQSTLPVKQGAEVI